MLLWGEVAPRYSQVPTLIPGVQDPKSGQVMTLGLRAQPISDPSPSTKPRKCLWSHRALSCHMRLLGYTFPLCSGLEGTKGH